MSNGFIVKLMIHSKLKSSRVLLFFIYSRRTIFKPPTDYRLFFVVGRSSRYRKGMKFCCCHLGSIIFTTV